MESTKNSQNSFEDFKNLNLLFDDEIDPDTFINTQLTNSVSDAPVYSAPYDNIPCSKNSLSIISFNIRSMSKNFDEFKIFLSTLPFKFSVICLQETWTKSEDTLELRYTLPGYNCFHEPRSNNTRGGGLCMYFLKELNVTE